MNNNNSTAPHSNSAADGVLKPTENESSSAAAVGASSATILSTETFEAWKKQVSTSDNPEKDQKKAPRCSTCLKYLEKISLIKVKHSGIWIQGQNSSSSNAAIIFSTIVTIYLLLYGIGQISSFGEKESVTQSLVQTAEFLAQQSTSTLRSWYSSKNLDIIGQPIPSTTEDVLKFIGYNGKMEEIGLFPFSIMITVPEDSCLINGKRDGLITAEFVTDGQTMNP